jgi:hypothetical protein
MMLMYGSPPVDRARTIGEYMCFIVVLERALGVMLPPQEARRWWTLYNEWYAASVHKLQGDRRDEARAD